MSLSVLGMGHAHAHNKLDNQFLEDLNVGTTAQWITEKIGIQTRLTTLPLDYIRTTRNQDPREAVRVAEITPTELGVRAATMALKSAGIDASRVGMLVTNCCTPYETCPSESHRLAAALGIGGQVYDVFTACPVFALHIDFLNSFDTDQVPEFILCVSTAALTQHVNYNDRSDGAIWGDGASAWVLSTRHQGKLTVKDSLFLSDPTRSQAVVVDTWGHFRQDGRAVRDFSVRQTVRLVKRLEEQFALDWTRDVFIGHQANLTMLHQITANREIPDQQHWHNVEHIGNQAGAGAPAVLSMHWDKIKPGMKIAVAVVGAGLSWGSVLFEAR